MSFRELTQHWRLPLGLVETTTQVFNSNNSNSNNSCNIINNLFRKSQIQVKTQQMLATSANDLKLFENATDLRMGP